MRKIIYVLLCVCIPVGAGYWCHRVSAALVESKVALRPITLADRAAISAILSHPKVLERSGDKFDPADFEGMVTPAGKTAWREQNFSIVDDHTGKIIGIVGIGKRTEDEVNLMYNLHPDYWGQGYASEAVHLMIDKTFYEFGIPKIRGLARAKNEPSWKLMEGVGFSRERQIPVGRPGQEEIYYQYSLEKPAN